MALKARLPHFKDCLKFSFFIAQVPSWPEHSSTTFTVVSGKRASTSRVL
jgi:hypothetical protein